MKLKKSLLYESSILKVFEMFTALASHIGQPGHVPVPKNAE